MGKAQQAYEEYLDTRPGKLNKLSESNLEAKTAANEAQIKAYNEADKAYGDAINVIESEGLKLQEAAMLENEEENKKAAKELEKKMAKELAKAKKAK
jgi:hypothetical protein